MLDTISQIAAEQTLSNIAPEDTATEPDFNAVVSQVSSASVLNTINTMSEFDSAEQARIWGNLYYSSNLKRALIADTAKRTDKHTAKELGKRDPLYAHPKRMRVEETGTETANRQEREAKRVKLTTQPATTTALITSPFSSPPTYLPAALARQPSVSNNTTSRTTPTTSSTTSHAPFDASIILLLRSEFNITSAQIAHGQKRALEAMAGTGPFTVTDELRAMWLRDAIVEKDREGR